METSFRIPGTLGPEITVTRSLLGNVKVLVDGQKAQRRGWWRPTYLIPMADGSTKELRVTGQWIGLKAIVDGNEIEIERRLRPWEIALTFLPFVLVVGGLIGGFFGATAWAINARLARSDVRAPIRAAGMILVSLVAAALYVVTVTTVAFLTAVAMAPVPMLTVGNCLDGIDEGATVSAAATRSVDCANPHENEVVASLDYSPDGAFPGQAALDAFALTHCPTAFESYVGISYEQSSLGMLPVMPTDLTWATGDRSIVCVVLTMDGSKLTGSVKGSGK